MCIRCAYCCTKTNYNRCAIEQDLRLIFQPKLRASEIGNIHENTIEASHLCNCFFSQFPVLPAYADIDIKKQVLLIDKYLKQSVISGFSGAVLVAKGDQALLSNGYGFADKEKQTIISSCTVFDIGSVTKQFTAAAILKLVEQNKLKVTDPLSKYFSDLPKDKQNITIHQLLTHTSGLLQGIGSGDFHHISY